MAIDTSPESAAVLAWRERMGWDQRTAAQALGMGLSGYQELERGRSFATGQRRSVKRSILLACAAIEHGVPPIGRHR